MLYNFVRWIIFFAIMGFVLLIVKKSFLKKHSKVSKVILVIVAVICFSQWNIPFENYVYSFPSLEKSFKYCSTDKHVEIFGFFEEENSGLVLYESENGYSNYIAQKTADGWKISNIKTCNVECAKNKNNYDMVVYRIKDTDERYVLISTDFTDNVSEITDSKGNKLKCVEDNDDFSNHITYFSSYSGNDFDYIVYIDGEKIDLKTSYVN